MRSNVYNIKSRDFQDKPRKNIKDKERSSPNTKEILKIVYLLYYSQTSGVDNQGSRQSRE